MSSPPHQHGPHESTSHVHPPNTPLGTTQSVLHFLGHAAHAVREGPPDRDTVMGAAQNVLSRLASSSTPHASHVHEEPVSYVPQRDLAGAPVPTEVPQRAAEPTIQGPAPTSVSSHGGGSGGRAITPPRGVARITRSNPALPEPIHPVHPPAAAPRPIRASHHSHGGVHRRTTGPYADSETAWHPYEDRDPVRSLMITSLLSWLADCSASVPSSVPRKKCWSALRTNHHFGERREV